MAADPKSRALFLLHLSACAGPPFPATLHVQGPESHSEPSFAAWLWLGR